MSTKCIELAGMSLDALENWMKSLGQPGYRGEQIFQWIHQKNRFDLDEMKNLPQALRDKLKESASLFIPSVLQRQTASDGTRKLLLEMQDGKRIETVLIPQRLQGKTRYSICVSTQIGCPIRCAFCATGKSGFYRNLKTHEIVGQVLRAKQELHDVLHIPRTEKVITNVVYMGMGEPFLNYETTMESVRLLNEHQGLDIGQRRITLSTSGEVKGIKKLMTENLQVTLAVSLHACNNTLRNQLVPLNRKYPLEVLMDALMQYHQKTGRRITFEYILLDHCNMSRKDADDLIRWQKPLGANINLIPYNPVPGAPFGKPPKKKIEEFMTYLREKNVNVTLRSEHGPSIQAACGQLAVRKG